MIRKISPIGNDSLSATVLKKRKDNMVRMIGGFVVALVCAAPFTPAQTPGQRQYYSEWKKHTTKNYFYRSYFYKKNSDDKAYEYHYGIFYPSRGKRVYMYNPHSKRFWGYWEGEKYSLLTAEKQKASIDEIAAEDFSPLGPAPNIPGIEEKTRMLAPPNDFPKLNADRP